MSLRENLAIGLHVLIDLLLVDKDERAYAVICQTEHCGHLKIDHFETLIDEVNIASCTYCDCNEFVKEKEDAKV